MLDKVTALMSEMMGEQTAESFHKFYEFDDDDEVVHGAQIILTNFVGPKVADKKLHAIRGKL